MLYNSNAPPFTAANAVWNSGTATGASGCTFAVRPLAQDPFGNGAYFPYLLQVLDDQAPEQQVWGAAPNPFPPPSP